MAPFKAIAVLVVIALVTAAPLGAAPLERLHFLIPAGPGGGWDGTARGIGQALRAAEITPQVSFENLSGGGGGRAIARFIETAPRQHGTLLISSTPMVVRSLQKIFPHSFRDLMPVASVIADYTAFVVAADGPIDSWPTAARRFRADPRNIKVAGGSVRGSTDHFVLAKAVQLAGGNPRSVIYVAYDGGGQAMAGLLSGEAQLLSTGLSEAIEMHRAGRARVIAVSAADRLPDAPDLPTLKEHGVDLTFANWRGFFAAPGTPEPQYERMKETLRALVATPAFEEVRRRNGWQTLHMEGDAFYSYLEQQELEIGAVMRELGFLR